jgi:hypothetical protein
MWIGWSWGVQRVRCGEGYLNCPVCRCRQPAFLFQMMTRTYLYGFIPMGYGDPVGPESYRCRICNNDFVADGVSAYDFGEHAGPRTWKCFKCKQEIPYDRFECPHCGYRFEVGRRD